MMERDGFGLLAVRITAATVPMTWAGNVMERDRGSPRRPGEKKKAPAAGFGAGAPAGLFSVCE